MNLYFLNYRSGITMEGQDADVSIINNKIQRNMVGLIRYEVRSDRYCGYAIVSDMEHEALSEKIFADLPADFDSRLWLISETSFSPEELLNRK